MDVTLRIDHYIHDAERDRQSAGDREAERLLFERQVFRRLDRIEMSLLALRSTTRSLVHAENAMTVKTNEMIDALHSETDAVKALAQWEAGEPDRTAAAVKKALDEHDVEDQAAQETINAARDEAIATRDLALQAVNANASNPVPVVPPSDGGGSGDAGSSSDSSGDGSDATGSPESQG